MRNNFVLLESMDLKPDCNNKNILVEPTLNPEGK